MPFPIYPAEAGLDLSELADGHLTVFGGVVRTATAKASYDHISFKPPAGARKAAKEGLALRREHKRGGTMVGVARARDIAGGRELSPSTVRRMNSFFARHEVDKKGKGFSPGEEGYPSNGLIAWKLWGGDAGWAWAKKVIRQMEASDAEACEAAFAHAERACAKCGGKVEAKADKYACATCEKDDVETVEARDHTLYYLKSVVVSTGFNLNGHFFPAEDLWAARATAAHKPFNLEHVKDDIIGHSLRSWAVDAALAPVDAAAGPPDRFHLMDESVIYLVRPGERGKALAGTLGEVEDGKYWVSMECLYLDFDYAVGFSPTGKFTDVAAPQVIKRTPETAHLTKYLRTVKQADGSRGPGVLPDGRMIGQVLRQITFTGKGLVKVPANPASALYTTEGQLLSGVLPSAEGGLLPSVYTPSDPNTETDMTIEQLQAELAMSKATLDAAAKAKADLEAAHAQAKADLEAELAKLKAELAEARKELSDAAEAKRLSERTGQLKLTLKLDDEAAAKLAGSLVALSDEAFAAHLDVVRPLVEPTPAPAKTELPAQASIVPETPTPAPAAPAPAPAPEPTKTRAQKAALATKTLLTKFNGSK